MRVSGSANNSDSENEIITNQLSLVTSFNTGRLKHDVSTGVEFTREEMKTRGWTVTVTGTSSLYNPQGTVHTALVRNTNGNGDSEAQNGYLLYFSPSILLKFHHNFLSWLFRLHN